MTSNNVVTNSYVLNADRPIVDVTPMHQLYIQLYFTISGRKKKKNNHTINNKKQLN